MMFKSLIFKFISPFQVLVTKIKRLATKAANFWKNKVLRVFQIGVTKLIIAKRNSKVIISKFWKNKLSIDNSDAANWTSIRH